MDITTPDNQRIGQAIFNFLEWLKKQGYKTGEMGERCADPYHIEDEKLIQLYHDWLKELQEDEII